MADKIRIALDAMGGDHGPAVVVAGADLALSRYPDSEFLFFGNSSLIGPLLDANVPVAFPIFLRLFDHKTANIAWKRI